MFYITSSKKTTPKQIRFTRNTDWELFRLHLESKMNQYTDQDINLTTTTHLDQACQDLTDHIMSAFELACPITYISNTIRKPPWLTPEIEAAQRSIKHKLMRARSNKTDTCWQDLRDSNKSYNKLLNNTRQREWRSFCENTESIKESARMNKILKSCSNKKEKLEAVYKTDDTLTNNATETLEVMLETHFKDDPASTNNASHTHVLPPKTLVDKIYDPKRLDEAVNSFDPDKAAGPDSIKPIILQKSWNLIKSFTRSIMMRSHELQHIPSPWTESKGIFLSKPGKIDYNQPKSFRTITLSPVLLKLQERVILWHMQHDHNMTDSLSKKQFGFKRGTSTETALHKIAHTIERRIAKKGYVLGTFLDIEGAFDNVSFKAISDAINSSPVDKSTAGWIINMVKYRHLTVTHKDITKRIMIRRGCPQGGILSPFLWNLVVDDLLKFSAKEIPGYLQAFADDLVTLAEGSDTGVIWQRTQKTINTIEKWCDTKGLNISALKTKIVMFTWNRNWTMRPISVGGNTITLSKTVKFLGVTLDNKLNYNTHIDNVTQKATAALMQCKRAVGPMWGLSPKTCKWIYTTVVRPILSYSATVWVRTLDNKNNLKKLERVQALALRIMTGAFPSTPFNSLNHLTETPHFGCYLKGEAAKGAARLQGYNDWTVETAPSVKGTIKSHSHINNNFLNELNISKKETKDLTKPILILDRNYHITTPNDEDTTKYRKDLEKLIKESSDNTITCYTDGSRTDSGVGAGFLTTTNNSPHNIINHSSFKLPDFCSVFQAEVTAIKEVTTTLQHNRSKTIVIWTDSLSTLQALSSKLSRSKTVIHCHEALDELAKHNTVHIKWIAAHVGHWGNKRADELAKIGTTSTNLVKGYIPQSHIKALINHKVHLLNQVEWANNGHGHTNTMLGNKHKHTIKSLNEQLINNRIHYRTALQLITGHIGLNKHLYNMNITNTTKCPACDYETETVTHFISQCPAYSQIRADYFHTYHSNTDDIFNKQSLTRIVGYALKTKRFLTPEEKDQSGVT